MGESYVSVAARELEKVLYFCESIKEKKRAEKCFCIGISNWGIMWWLRN